jgi:hypothetical protein
LDVEEFGFVSLLFKLIKENGLVVTTGNTLPNIHIVFEIGSNEDMLPVLAGSRRAALPAYKNEIIAQVSPAHSGPPSLSSHH